MSTNAKRQQYDIAINGQGFILVNEPEQPILTAKQDPIFSQRIAQGDKTYNDFMSWWYMVQTDWYPGFKDIIKFGDADSITDGLYYYASNIDAISQPGALQLAQNCISNFAANGYDIVCGVDGTVNGTHTQFIGTDNSGSAVAKVWKKISGTSWQDISPTINTAYQVNQLNAYANLLWIHGQGGGSTDIVATSNGTTTWVDQSLLIGGNAGVTPFSWAITSSPCATATLEGIYYVFVSNIANNEWGLIKTSSLAPSAVSDWGNGSGGGALITRTNQFAYPVSCVEFLGNIYYLLSSGELRVYNVQNATDSSLITFRNAAISSGVAYPNLLVNSNGLLYITIPQKQVWTFDGTNFARIYNRDIFKGTLGQDAYAYLNQGLVVNDNNIYLVIINESQQSGGSANATHSWIKDANDTTNGVFIPLFSDSSNNIWGIDNITPGRLYEVTYQGSNFKGVSGTNYLLFNNFDLVSGIDKLARFVSFVFKTLATGQKITWQYLLNELTPSPSWTTLGTAEFDIDGAITNKTLFFPDGTVFKKIWFKVLLDGPGSTTPVLYDGPIMAFLPMPDYKLHWNFTVKCQNKIKLKDDTAEEKDALWLRNFLQNAWLTKSVLSYEDFDSMALDYIADNPLTATATTINAEGSTDNFPEFGRLLIDTEEIFYSGKNKTQFLNCTRGARSSNPVSHTQGAAINMARRVIIRDYQETLMLANQPLNTEYHVSLALQEV